MTSRAFPITVFAGLWLGLTKPGWKEMILLILLVSFFFLWAATFWMARFLLPAVGLAASVAGIALVRVNPGIGKFWWVGVSLLALFNAAVIAAESPNRQAFRPALGLQTREDYLSSRLRAYPAIDLINRTLPRNARVLVVGDEKVAYLRRDHIYNTAHDTPVLKEILDAGRLPGQLSSAFAARGVTHVLVNYAEAARLQSGYGTFTSVQDRLDDLFGFLERSCKKLYAERKVVVYELP